MNQAIIDRGRHAEALLNRPEFKATLANVREDLFKQFSRTNVANTAEREDIHKIAYAVDLLENLLVKYVGDGLYELAGNKPE